MAVGLAAIAYLSLQVGGLSYKGEGGLELVAAFDEIGGLRERAPVAIAGVTVGQVTKIELDEMMRARVTLDIESGLELPIDSSAAIRTSGVLGGARPALDVRRSPRTPRGASSPARRLRGVALPSRRVQGARGCVHTESG